MRLVAIQASEPSRDPARKASNRPTIVYPVNQYTAVSHTLVKREVLGLHAADREAAALTDLFPMSASRRYHPIGIDRRLPAAVQ
jgi:hypothetical protein